MGVNIFIYMVNENIKKIIREYIQDRNLSDDWTHDIVEYLQGYYGNSRNYNKLYKLIKEVVDMGLSAKSFDSFHDFLGHHNPKYHETNKVGNYKNLWWGNVEKDGVDEKFMYEVIGIMDYVIDER